MPGPSGHNLPGNRPATRHWSADDKAGGQLSSNLKARPATLGVVLTPYTADHRCHLFGRVWQPSITAGRCFVNIRFDAKYHGAAGDPARFQLFVLFGTLLIPFEGYLVDRFRPNAYA